MGNTIERVDSEGHCRACGQNVEVHQVLEIGPLSADSDGKILAEVSLMGQSFHHDCRPQTPRSVRAALGVPEPAPLGEFYDALNGVQPTLTDSDRDPGEEEENPDEEEARNAALLARVLGEVAEQNAHLPTLSSPS